MKLDGRDTYLKELIKLAGKKLELGFLVKEGRIDPKLFENMQKAEEAFFLASSEAFERGFFLPLEYLSGILEWSPFERHCILMALGYELGCPSIRDCARLNGNEIQWGLTPDLLGWTWQGPADMGMLCGAFREDGLLMKFFFQKAGAESPFLGRLLCLNPRIRSFLLWDLGLSGEDSRVMELCQTDKELPPLAEYQPDVAAALDEETDVAELWGPEGSGRRFCARAACKQMGRGAVFVSLKEAAACGWTPKETARRAVLECVLYQAAPVLLIPGQWERPERELWLGALIKPLSEAAHPVFAITGQRNETAIYGRNLMVQSFELQKMTIREAKKVWSQEAERFSFDPDVRPEEMAGLFPFTRGQIREALSHAASEARQSISLTEQKVPNQPQRKECGWRIGRESLRRGCYSLFEKQVVSKAVRIPCLYGWEELVLPGAQKEKLKAAAGQVRHRQQIYEEWGFQQKMPYGRGVSMIFAGPPGTGKTMAAQVFAGELGLDLYRVELSLVVSKYVGETEKNLNEIFSQAEKSRVVLFFDEADVLFSKRTEVKDANDKYSNMEAAFLLQKMEACDGVTVLATNLIQNFDEAFKRRVKFIIDFPFPGREERKELWHRAVPAKMPVEDLDYEYLASAFELSGSNIRNIVLHGAFLAAEAGKAMGMEELLKAVKNEYSKGGKILTREELGEYHMLLPEVK